MKRPKQKAVSAKTVKEAFDMILLLDIYDGVTFEFKKLSK